MSATQISNLIELSRQTINKHLSAIRGRFVEVDESYFGTRHIKGVRGRGARGKVIVFELLKRGDKVCTEIIRGKPALTALYIPMDVKGYNGLLDFGEKKHFWVYHADNEFA